MVRALEHYDLLTEKKAGPWEKQHHPGTPDTPAWFGYCHAWSASAVMEKEPTEKRSAAAPHAGPVELLVGS